MSPQRWFWVFTSFFSLFLLHSFWRLASFNGKEAGPRALQVGPSEAAVKYYANREVVALVSHPRSGSTLAELLFFRTVEGFVYFDEPLYPFLHYTPRNAAETTFEKVDALMAMLSDCEAYETMVKASLPPKELAD